MPVNFSSEYKPSFFFKNNDINTIFPNLTRKFRNFRYRRERIKTPDQDFIDLDISSVNSKTAAIILHGLEGNSMRHYMIGMAESLNSIGIDAVSFNFRGCSGEMNLKPHAYHSGFTEDLHEVINHTGKRYRQLYLIGFSLGGNMVLKYLGEKKYSVPGKIKKAFVFSVPCDLMSSSRRMLHIRNYFYSKRFLVMLTGKIRAKKFLFSEHPKKEKCGRIKSITDFDNCYTAPMHGFSDASDYYKKSSSRQYLKNIKTPTEMICSLDDPFLTEDCFPFAEAMSNRNINLTMYEYGGHMGFVQKGKKQTWLEEFTVREIGSEINKSGKRANK